MRRSFNVMWRPGLTVIRSAPSLVAFGILLRLAVVAVGGLAKCTAVSCRLIPQGCRERLEQNAVATVAIPLWRLTAGAMIRWRPGVPVTICSSSVASRNDPTVHDVEAGVGSTRPSGSVAWAENVCSPGPTAVQVAGELQGLQAEPSSWHWKVEPGRVEKNTSVAVVDCVGLGGLEVITVWGGEVSIVQVSEAGF